MFEVKNQFFPTPKAIAEKMIAPYIKIVDVTYSGGRTYETKRLDIEYPLLEPSAGKGDLLDAICEIRDDHRRDKRDINQKYKYMTQSTAIVHTVSASMVDVPDSVISRLKWLINDNLKWNQQVNSARQCDRTFSGGGRYVYESCAEFDCEESDYFSEFRRLANENGVNADQVLADLGFVPKIRLTHTEKNWASLPA